MTSQTYDIEKVRNKVKLEHKELVRKGRAEVKTSDEHVGAKRNDPPSRYRVVLQSNRRTVNATDGRKADHADVWTQIQVLCEKRRKSKAVSSTDGLSQDRLGAFQV